MSIGWPRAKFWSFAEWDDAGAPSGRKKPRGVRPRLNRWLVFNEELTPEVMGGTRSFRNNEAFSF